MKHSLTLFVRTGLGCAVLLVAGTAVRAVPQGRTAPDNTKTNQRDRNQASPTADQQKANSGDTDVTKQIRSSIMKDKSLSTYAHNVKVISQDGKVTLKGPVRSEDEKDKVAAKASAIVGEGNIVNEITVAPPKK